MERGIPPCILAFIAQLSKEVANAIPLFTWISDRQLWPWGSPYPQ